MATKLTKKTTRKTLGTCGKHGLGITSTELDKKHPDWDKGQTTKTGQHSTQITSTESTYKKIGAFIKKEMPSAKMLDASSGLGRGTIALRNMGFVCDDVEPFCSSNRIKPTYTDYNDIRKKYDVVISNAVLNVIPDDWRDSVLRQMAKVTAAGGRIIINVRDANEIRKQKQKIVLDDDAEILVTNAKGGIVAYQKGFTKPNLKAYCEKILGSSWKVVGATVANSGITGMAVVCYKI